MTDQTATVDPILRCDDCRNLCHVKVLAKIGCCPECGNRRYKSIQLFSEIEWEALSNKTYDFGMKEWPKEVDEFIKLFEEVDPDKIYLREADSDE